MTSSLRSNGSRWLTTILAVALVLGLLVGSNQNTAQAIDPGQTDIAYVADGYNFPDALMGATLAGLNTAPMLGVRGPTSGDVVPPETAAELDRLTNDKANKLATIYVFGGSAAVSDKVVGELGAWAGTVTRIAGANRFATMTEISEALPSKARDSDLLDGMDSSDFLGATAKAADSELLDGLDSLELAPFAAATGTDAETGATDTFADLPGATVEITVPEGHDALILTRFTAESRCTGADGTWCSVRILVDGTEAEPASGADFAFDSPGDTPGQDWESHAMERSFGPVGPGTYTVTVQRELENGATSFRLDDWHLTAEARLTS